MRRSENAAYATVYWLMGRLCPNVFPVEKLELAAETAIRYYVMHKSTEECLSYIGVFRLYESEFWKSL